MPQGKKEGGRGTGRRTVVALHLAHDDTIESLLEPGSGLLLLDTVGGTDARNLLPAAGDTGTRAGHADHEVHTEDSDTRVVLDAEVNVLVDTEAEVAGVGEVAALELVLLDLEATLEDLLSLGAADGDVASDLLVTSDTETTEGVLGLAGDGSLTSKLLKNLGGTSKPVTRLSHGDVDDELVDLKLLLHGSKIKMEDGQ